MRRKLIWMSLAVALTASPLLAQPPQPQPSPAPPANRQPLIQAPVVQELRSGRLVMNYENIDIKVLARIMAELTGRNVLIDESVQGRVTVLSSREVTPDEAWEIFKATLTKAGFGFRQKGAFLQVLPLADARRESPLYHGAKGNPRENTTAVLIMKEGDSQQILTAIRPLLSDANFAQSYAPGKAIILVEKREIVAKIAELMHRIDRASPRYHVSILFAQYAETEKLAPILQNVLARQNLTPGMEQPPRIVAFPPTNSLVVQGTDEQIVEVKKVMEQIDVPKAAPLTQEKPRYFLYRLRNGNAEEVAKLLEQMLQERKALLQREQQNNQRVNTTTPNVAPPPPSAGGGNSTVPPPPTAPASAAADSSKSPIEIPFVSAKVSADKETNSVVVYLSPTEYPQIRNLLSALDQSRKQVLVHAMVAEVSLSRLLETGVRLQGISAQGIVGAYNGGVSQEGLLSLLTGGNFVLGAGGGGSVTVNVNGRDVKVPTFFGFISANKQSNDFDLLSSPRLMTSDHKKATMKVGNVVPFPTGARFSQNGAPIVTYDYKDVGIKLEFTPHMSQSDTIRMELEQEVQEVTDFLTQNLGGTGYSIPLISSRSVKTNVTLRDGETLVIGGLISKRTTETIRKVPILGDLPLINNLFTELRKEDRKTTLFVALTPYVVRSPEDVARIDRAYEMFAKGEPLPGDAQSEPRNSKASRHLVVSPYESDGSGTQAPRIELSELAVLDPRGSDRLRQPRVTVRNGEGDVEVVLRGTVRRPDGKLEQFSSESIRLESQQAREVALPPYAFPLDQGVYEFDLEAVVSDRVVARIPVPKKVKLTGP